MSLIRVDLTYVMSLHDRTQQTADRLREDERDLGGTPSAEPVQRALISWRRDWDERRDELAGTLENVAGALLSIHDSFLGTDEELRSELESGGN